MMIRQMIPRRMKAPISIRTAAPVTADARNSSLGSIGDLTLRPQPRVKFTEIENVSVPNARKWVRSTKMG